MENEKIPQGKIIYIRFDNGNMNLDPESIKWLERFIDGMADETIRFENLSDSEPSEMEELEYLDSTVTGDHHPEVLAMIMDAYNKHCEQP